MISRCWTCGWFLWRTGPYRFACLNPMCATKKEEGAEMTTPTPDLAAVVARLERLRVEHDAACRLLESGDGEPEEADWARAAVQSYVDALRNAAPALIAAAREGEKDRRSNVELREHVRLLCDNAESLRADRDAARAEVERLRKEKP